MNLIVITEFECVLNVEKMIKYQKMQQIFFSKVAYFFPKNGVIWPKNGSKNVLIAEVSKIWVLAIFYYITEEQFQAKI